MNVASDKPLDHLEVRKRLARIPPPPAFALSTIVGVVLGGWIPLAIVPESLHGFARVAGVVLMGLGLALAGTCVAQFFRRHTTIVPHRSASALVTSGPYRLSRNPMYVALTLESIAVAAFFNVLWPILLLPAPLLLVSLAHIPFEEHTLHEVFGDDYRHYASRVRRWL